MGSAFCDNRKLELCNKDKSEKYSSDASINKNKSDEMNKLYEINFYLMIIYYILLIIFVAIIFRNVNNSSHKKRKYVMIVLLFLYPIIIFPIQHNLYYFVKNIINYFYQDIYLSKSW